MAARFFILRTLSIVAACSFMTACGFHFQGDKPLTAPLHHMYVQAPDPYGTLAVSLERNLKIAKVKLASSPQEASVILNILKDENLQEMISVSGSQQTRQFKLITVAEFEISDSHGRTIVQPQTLSETRIITVQSNQILGSSNEAALFYQQMRRTLAYSIINRLASPEVTKQIDAAFPERQGRKKT